MSEAEFIDILEQRWPGDDATSEATLNLALAAVSEWPQSAVLWMMLGDLIQLLPLNAPLPSWHPRECYERAISLDPNMAEAWASLGIYLDIYDDDYSAAEAALRRAVELKADCDTYVVLARVIAEQGRTQEALCVVRSDQCPYASDPEVLKMKNEIERGMWAPND